MGGILGKILKGKDLLSQLKEHYPSKDVQPFGKVLMIPNSDFRGCWKDELASKGIKTYVQALDGQSIFLVKLEADEPTAPDTEKGVAMSSPTQEPEKPDSLMVKPWTSEENLEVQTLLAQGVSCSDIALKLGRSVYSVAAKSRHLLKEPKAILDAAFVKELLAAASELYPQYKHASALLSRQAADKMEN
jgi:DNA-binding CsgD family transcriptional regulator